MEHNFVIIYRSLLQILEDNGLSVTGSMQSSHHKRGKNSDLRVVLNEWAWNSVRGTGRLVLMIILIHNSKSWILIPYDL